MNAEPLAQTTDEAGGRVWTFPPLDRRAGTDPSWAGTLDTLRAPRKQNQKLADWRREAPIRPVVFEDAGVLTEDTVHLHLEQRVGQRLLARSSRPSSREPCGISPPASSTGCSSRPTPHNGHSNSFSTLLELLDLYRFTRGVKVRGKALAEIMVRRLKEDIREIQVGFPKRNVVRTVINGLPDDAPELVLSRLLDEYRTRREERFASTTRRAKAAAGLLVVGLQQRLLSSTEAFARSLKVHRATANRQWEKLRAVATNTAKTIDREAELFTTAPDSDDERGEWSAEALEVEETAQIEAVTVTAEAETPRDAAAEALWRREQALLDRMQEIAEKTRHLPDAKTRRLIDWIRENLCLELPPFGQQTKDAPPKWNNRRVLIFTENREGTKRYLKTILEQAIEDTDRADERIEVIDGLTSGNRRKEIQRRFNTHPAKDPLRILLATDCHSAHRSPERHGGPRRG